MRALGEAEAAQRRASKRRKESVPTSTLGCSRAADTARHRHNQALWMWSVASRGSGRANAAQAAEAASRILIASLKRETGAEREWRVERAAWRGTRVKNGLHDICVFRRERSTTLVSQAATAARPGRASAEKPHGTSGPDHGGGEIRAREDAKAAQRKTIQPR